MKISKRNVVSRASQRISFLFLDLLERQFPITNNNYSIDLRYPHQFAQELNITVNHLNRALKETFAQTTTHIISERLLREAKQLLTKSDLGIADIAYALGFNEATHFNNFFKKHTQVSPTKFRTV